MRSITSRRFAVTAATAVLSLGSVAGTAHADASQPPVHGCLAGDACTYDSPLAFDQSAPTTSIPAKINAQSLVALVNVGVQDIAVLANNTDPQYTSEGDYALDVNVLGLSVCVYVPDAQDEQAPDTTETIPDPSTPVDVIAFGPTAASVDSPIVVGIDDCE
jgi:hypothetical protein